MTDLYDLIVDQDLNYEDTDAVQSEFIIDDLQSEINSNCGPGNPLRLGSCAHIPDLFTAMDGQQIEWEQATPLHGYSEGVIVPNYFQVIISLAIWGGVLIFLGGGLWWTAGRIFQFVPCKYRPLKSKNRSPCGAGEDVASFPDIAKAVAALRLDDYIIQLWIDPDRAICRFRQIGDGVCALLKLHVSGETAHVVKTNALLACINELLREYDVLLPAGNGVAGGLTSLIDSVDIEEQVMLADVIGRLIVERDRVAVCRNCLELFVATENRVITNLHRDTALRNVKDVAYGLSLCKLLEQKFRVFAMTQSSAYATGAAFVQDIFVLERNRLCDQHSELLQHASNRLKLQYSEHILASSGQSVQEHPDGNDSSNIQSISFVQETQTSTVDDQIVQSTALTAAVADTSQIGPISVMNSLDNRASSRWRFALWNAETEANKDLKRDLNELDVRKEKLYAEEMSRASQRVEQIEKELDLAAVEIAYYSNQKTLAGTARAPAVEDLLAKRERQKGWQNSRMYYFFCAVALISTYLYCGGAVAARHNNTISLFDVKNFQYWLSDQSSAFCSHLNSQCRNKRKHTYSVQPVARISPSTNARAASSVDLFPQYQFISRTVHHSASSHQSDKNDSPATGPAATIISWLSPSLPSFASLFPPLQLSLSHVLGGVAEISCSLLLSSSDVNCSFLKDSVFTECASNFIGHCFPYYAVSFLLFALKFYKFSNVVAYVGMARALLPALWDYVASSYLFLLPVLVLVSTYVLLLCFDTRVSWRVYRAEPATRDDTLRPSSLNLRVWFLYFLFPATFMTLCYMIGRYAATLPAAIT